MVMLRQLYEALELVSKGSGRCQACFESILDLDLLKSAFRDVDCVFHQAAISSVQEAFKTRFGPAG